jgi:hypothetical protein
MVSKAPKAAEQPLLDRGLTLGARVGSPMWRWVQRGTASWQSSWSSSEAVRRPRYPSCIGKYAWQFAETTNPKPVS